MMNPLKQLRIRREQDRVALAIAERYGLRYEYESARANGLSPMEALEDWDLLSVENLKTMERVGAL